MYNDYLKRMPFGIKIGPKTYFCLFSVLPSDRSVVLSKKRFTILSCFQLFILTPETCLRSSVGCILLLPSSALPSSTQTVLAQKSKWRTSLPPGVLPSERASCTTVLDRRCPGKSNVVVFHLFSTSQQRNHAKDLPKKICHTRQMIFS